MKPNSLKKQTRKTGLWLAFMLLVVVGLAMTHDIILTNIISYWLCKAEPQPKTFVRETVEYPGSIYWEDNVYPGYDEKDRLLMIRNYLDGVHLKTMAVNGPDGFIYLYNATAEDWQGSSEIKKETQQGWKDYFEKIETETSLIAARGKIFTLESLPPLNYSVVFNPVALTPFQQRYLYSDEVTITDNKKGEVIAYNCRLMHRWYMLFPDIALGNRYYYPEAMCGWAGYAGFDDKVFPINRVNGMNHLQSINNIKYTNKTRKTK